MAPDSTVTSGPKTTFGPITTSRPITVSRANQTVAGSVSVAPFSSASARARAWKAASAAARSARELTPSVSASGQVIAAAVEPAGAGERDDVGQVVFALGVVVARPRRAGRGAVARVGGHQAGVAEADRRARPASRRAPRRCAARPVGVGDQPAVAARVGGLEAEHDDGGAAGAGVEHGLERLGADQRRVAVEDDDVALEAVERRGGLQHGVAGAELLGLDDDAEVVVDGAAGGGDRLGAVAGDERRCARARALRAAARAWARSGTPASGCSTLGRSEFIRVPWPAASTMTAVGMRRLLRSDVGRASSSARPGAEKAAERSVSFQSCRSGR